MDKKIKIYEARLKCSSDQISSGTGGTEIEALEDLKKSAKKWDLTIEQLQKEYAVVKLIDITDEVKKYKKKADRILNRLEEILNLIPQYDQNIHVCHIPNCIPENKARIVVSHNLAHISNQVYENYKKIFNENTNEGIFKFRQFVSHIHINFFISYNVHKYYALLGPSPRKGLKEVATYKFVNPRNVSDHDMIICNCRYFGNLDQYFCVDFKSKYANEILASSFATRGYQKKWEYDAQGEIIN